MLEAFSVVAEPSNVAAAITARCGDAVDRISFYAPYKTAPGLWDEILGDLKAA